MRIQGSALSLAVGLALAGTARAAEPVDTAPQGDAALRARLQRVSDQLESQQVEIAQLRQQVEWLELAQRGRGVQAPGQDAGASQVAQAADANANPVAAAEPPQQVGEVHEEEDAARREQQKALVIREHAPLFERRFTLDAGLNYSYYDRRELALSGYLALDAIFLGNINLDQSKATIATLDVTGRYGLTDRLSVEANVPWVWRDSRFVSAGAGGASTQLSEVGIRSSGIGDASIAAYYQVVKESARWPDLVASLRVHAPTGRDPFGLKLIQPDGNNNNLNVPETLPTGTGVWNTTVNLSALRTYDPVIMFANVGYTMYRSQDFGDVSPVVGTVSPATVSLGNAVQVSGGLAIALNDRSAISFSVSSSLAATTHTTSPGKPEQRVPGSESNSTALNIGATYSMPSEWIFNGQLAAGLTPDAPNFVFSLRTSRAF